ncbi:MAG: PD-(D/E)XK nuclease family protein, partial [Defluviitaleaceae bacterium]|nr:PD-(D/E)XK nuclease family protein [Defluviitaleaceae bacterium]
CSFLAHEKVRQARSGHRGHVSAATHSLEAGCSLLLHEKAANFLRDLKIFRDAAVYMPVSRLIGKIFDTTRYPAHVANMPGGSVRQANLRLLLERAIEFEATSLRGLFHFTRYIERLIEAGGLSAAASPVQIDDAVRLMSIHKSKGLEFPVVICAFLAKRFNTEDERLPIILHSDLGVGPYYINTALRTRANTLARAALARLTRRENLSEELRCLYVATTRAQERLILTGRANATSMQKWTDNLSASAYLDWIMPCVLDDSAQEFFEIREHRGEGLFDRSQTLSRTPRPDRADCRHAGSSGSAPLQKNLHCENSNQNPLPQSHKNALPSKLSISEIKRLYDITPDSSFREELSPSFEPPEFLAGDKTGGVTAARLGSAMHVVTEHIDFVRHRTREKIEELLRELLAKNFLNIEEFEAIERGKIEKLIYSPIGERLKKASEQGRIFRETPFVLALDASKLYGDTGAGEKILVHGIIDCHFEEDEKIVLIDFKNDFIPHGTELNEWAKKHRTQLEIYKEALEKSTDTAVSEVLLYSFARGCDVRM